MQLPAIRIAKELGLSPHAVDGDPGALGASLADGFARVDLKDEAGLIDHALSLKRDGGLHAVFTAGTDFSPAVAMVAEAAGLPGIPVSAARRAQDKRLMRKALADAGVPCPRFASVSSAGEAAGAAAGVPPPWVVKPADSMGGRGCVRIDDPRGLEEACAEAIAYSRTGRAIIEEYLDGPEFSVDALVWNDAIIPCGVADRHIRFPPRFIEMGHTMPSARPRADIEEVLRAFEAGVRAIGISLGAAKGDIKLCPDGRARVGEIAARLSGGYMSGWTYPYASGVEATAGAIRIAMGRDPGDMRPRFSRVCAERAFISIPGRVREIAGVDEARGIPGVRDLFLRAAPGATLRFPRNNVEKCGNAIAAAEERDEAVRAAEEAAARILIRLEPGVDETDSFLMEDSGFPPSAFSGAPDDIVAAAEALPEAVEDATGEGIGIIDLPLDSGREARDWHGMDLKAARDAALSLTGARLGAGRVLLGRKFWKALLRGGYQGGAYVIDAERAGLGGRGDA